ncbi:sensor domain-containing phosphodiesterase [Arthrobacter sp. Leaf337]|uniref:sensor domain-containing phosphodiesterase n=1 Tax=Arthrobacter sp. Leaf337 TaxID=1736342 RepID=UPI001F23D317|nr:EAL domain-containing protein [Arthrobacter sp. Leaf337]
MTVQVVFVLAAGAVVILDPAEVLEHLGVRVVAGSLVLMPIVMVCLVALRFRRNHRSERIHTGNVSRLLDRVLSTSHEWIWAVDDEWKFTFSSQTSADLLGYLPAELIGEPCSVIIDPDDLARARGAVAISLGREGSSWNGLTVRCRHRDGSTVWMEVSGGIRPAADGQPGGFDGTSRMLPRETAQEAAASRSQNQIREIIDGKLLLTAFQPIHSLGTGHLIGVEALSRFVSDDGAGAEYWFQEAAAVGLSAELEFAALTTALEAARELPPLIYVALNISPATCLDPGLPGLLERSSLPLDRMVLEQTERLEVPEYGPLIAALAPLRERGLRIAVDDAGSGFASMRHVLHVRPDIIKLDRSLTAGIDDDQGQRALGAALAEFARRIGATLVAEGIETQAELAAVTGLGMAAGQGYLLGRPSVHPREWAAWHQASTRESRPPDERASPGPGPS